MILTITFPTVEAAREFVLDVFKPECHIDNAPQPDLVIIGETDTGELIAAVDIVEPGTARVLDQDQDHERGHT